MTRRPTRPILLPDKTHEANLSRYDGVKVTLEQEMQVIPPADADFATLEAQRKTLASPTKRREMRVSSMKSSKVLRLSEDRKRDVL